MKMHFKIGFTWQKYWLLTSSRLKNMSQHIKNDRRILVCHHLLQKTHFRFNATSLTIGLAGVVRIIEDKDIRKAKTDKRKYRGLELKNGMKVLLVHDPNTDKAAMAFDVQVGCMMDPRHLPGLAHLTEHMLFLGTEKYPKEDEFRKFVSSHGGSFNASTGLEHTNYHLTVSAKHIQPAFDRFVQFIVCPLFNASAVDREINAVDNEHRRNLQSDNWRLLQLRRSLTRPDHDLNKFGSGNKSTLGTGPKNQGVNIREELLKFHHEFYSANVMGVCVLGRHSLDELTEMVLPDLLKVENKQVKIQRWDTPPYDQSDLPCLVSVVPIKDVREMTVSWPMPGEMTESYKQKPVNYISHLFGHEGKGSLLSELKARGLATDLVSGYGRGANGFSFFDLTISLTHKGQEDIEQILELIYQYANYIKREEPQKWIYDDNQRIANIQFDFRDKDSAHSFTKHCAKHLQTIPMEDILWFPYMSESFQPGLIRQALSKITPKNMIVFVLSKKFIGLTDKIEQWYGTQYKVERFSKLLLKDISNPRKNYKLHFPEKNKYIPENFDIVPRDKAHNENPKLIKNTTSRRLWFKQDDKYLKPKLCVNLALSNPLAYASPRFAAMNHLFARLFEESFSEDSYMAKQAGLYYHVAATRQGLNVTAKGFSDKLDAFLEKTINKLTRFTVDATKLEIIKEDYKRSLKNFHADQPFNQANYYVSHLVLNTSWGVNDIHARICEVSVEDVENFIKDMLSELYVEGLIYGNVTEKQASKMYKKVEDTLSRNCATRPLSNSFLKKSREVNFSKGSYYVRNESNCIQGNYGTELYLQCGEQSSKSNVLLELLALMIKEPAFSILRTKEQLGYIVFSGVRRSHGTQGLRFLIQSAVSSEYVEFRIEAFIKHMGEKLQNMSSEMFENYKESLIKSRLRTAKSIHDQNSQYWSEIVKGTYHFNRDTTEVGFLKKITKEDLLEFYREYIELSGKNRKKLVVRVIPAETCTNINKKQVDLCAWGFSRDELFRPPSLPRPTFIENISDFKLNHGLYPAPKHYLNHNEFIIK